MTDVKEPPIKSPMIRKDGTPAPLWVHWFQNLMKAISSSEAGGGEGDHATSDGSSHSDVVANSAHAASTAIHLNATQKDDLTDGGETSLHTHAEVTTSARGMTPTLPDDNTKFFRGDGTWSTPAHNDTPSLQGGTRDEYYHLSEKLYSALPFLTENLLPEAGTMEVHDTPVEDAVTEPISSNWAHDHETEGDHSEVRLTPKTASSGPEGTMFYCSDDDYVYVGTE